MHEVGSLNPSVSRQRRGRASFGACCPDCAPCRDRPAIQSRGPAPLALGIDYRELWTKPIEVEVLDLEAFAGGLAPVARVGGRRRRAWPCAGPTGATTPSAAIDKDPTSILPEDLRDTWVRGLVQDQIAASQPAAFLVVDELMDAAGILHTEPRLVVMPDDARLGEFRPGVRRSRRADLRISRARKSEPNPGFQGALEILKHEDFYARLAAGYARARPDARAFLKARLFDLMIGDWDRHRDQWRWAKFPGQPRGSPSPTTATRPSRATRASCSGLARPPRALPPELRRRLPEHEGPHLERPRAGPPAPGRPGRPAYKEVAAELQSADHRRGDRQGACGGMPAEYARARRARLAHDLNGRRDRLGRGRGGLLRAPRGQGEGLPDRRLGDTSRSSGSTAATRSCGCGRVGPTGSRAGEPFFAGRFARERDGRGPDLPAAAATTGS